MTMQVNGTSPSYLGAFANADSLTADSLLMYCQSQLNNLDGEIKTYMDQQKNAIKHKAAWASIEAKMKEYHDGKWTKNGNHWADIGKTMLQAIDSLEPNDPMRQEIEQFRIELADASLKGPMSMQTFKSWTDKARSKLEDVKGNAELNMIQLQSIMSRRQTAVQLTTNMLSKYDQTVASIVNNLK